MAARHCTFAVGNSRLTVALSMALAPPLLHVVEMEGGGLHFRGSSSIGKTTLLHVAGSVWGGGGLAGYVRRWRATDNALEGVAQSALRYASLRSTSWPRSSRRQRGGRPTCSRMARARRGRNRAGETRPVAEWRCCS